MILLEYCCLKTSVEIQSAFYCKSYRVCLQWMTGLVPCAMMEYTVCHYVVTLVKVMSKHETQDRKLYLQFWNATLDNKALSYCHFLVCPSFSFCLSPNLSQSFFLYTYTVQQCRVRLSVSLRNSRQAFGPLMSLGEWWHVTQGTKTLFSIACFHTATARPSPQHVAINCDVLWWGLIDTNLTQKRRGGERMNLNVSQGQGN